MIAAEENTEKRTQVLIRALQDVHLAVVQKKLSSESFVLERVQWIRDQIEADSALEKSVRKAEKASKKHSARKQKEAKNQKERRN